jgi:hypothetical protein
MYSASSERRTPTEAHREIEVIPAPGAPALLGLAGGLCARRRRRAAAAAVCGQRCSAGPSAEGCP